MKLNPFASSALVLAAILTLPASASLVVTYAESPDAETSSLSGTSVFDFNNLSVGVHAGVTWTGVGTYNSLSILANDQYGGAGVGGSNYSVQSNNVNLGDVTSTTLTLEHPSAYFGLWWSAGDPENVMNFYSGSSLVAHFTTANLMAKLDDTYYGKPSSHTQDSSEPFGFINLYGSLGTTWDKIVFTNQANSGFESDNHTTRVAAWGTQTGETGPPPGILLETISAVPEPSGIVATGSILALGLCLRRRSAS